LPPCPGCFCARAQRWLAVIGRAASPSENRAPRHRAAGRDDGYPNLRASHAFWRRRTKVWRKITSLAVGRSRLRSGEILGNSDRHATPVALSGRIGQNWIGRIGVTPATAPFGQLIGLAPRQGCGVWGKEEAIMLSGLSSVGFPPASPALRAQNVVPADLRENIGGDRD
jgi:hypothetical protein